MRKIWWIALAVLGATGCREDDGPLDGTGAGTLVVLSSPSGGRISIDGRTTGGVTPDTIFGVSGLRQVLVELDTAGIVYRYNAQVVVTGSEPTVLNGPLMARCQQQVTTCARAYHDEHVVGTTRFITNALGPVFLENAAGGGLYWPAQSSNSYMSTTTPVFAGVWDGLAVSTGVYDTEYFAGRPAPRTDQLAGGPVAIQQHTWILPPVSALPLAVARGIQIEERLFASPAVEGVFLLELTYRNISRDPLYHIVDSDPEVVAQGVTWTDAYIGLALDPDIGAADDDWMSYDESLGAVYAYDAAFLEGGFSTQQSSPALVGVRVLRAPAGAGTVLNGWTNVTQGTTGDWQAGTQSQVNGYGMLSGLSSYAPDHPGTLVGHLPGSAGDVRITATVGPLRLAPGESATAVFAIALGLPSAGTFTSGQVVPPGTPGDTGRPIHAVAANLRARLIAAEALLPLLQ